MGLWSWQFDKEHELFNFGKWRYSTISTIYVAEVCCDPWTLPHPLPSFLWKVYCLDKSNLSPRSQLSCQSGKASLTVLFHLLHRVYFLLESMSFPVLHLLSLKVACLFAFKKNVDFLLSLVDWISGGRDCVWICFKSVNNTFLRLEDHFSNAERNITAMLSLYL